MVKKGLGSGEPRRPRPQKIGLDPQEGQQQVDSGIREPKEVGVPDPTPDPIPVKTPDPKSEPAAKKEPKQEPKQFDLRQLDLQTLEGLLFTDEVKKEFVEYTDPAGVLHSIRIEIPKGPQSEKVRRALLKEPLSVIVTNVEGKRITAIPEVYALDFIAQETQKELERELVPGQRIIGKIEQAHKAGQHPGLKPLCMRTAGGVMVFLRDQPHAPKSKKEFNQDYEIEVVSAKADNGSGGFKYEGYIRAYPDPEKPGAFIQLDDTEGKQARRAENGERWKEELRDPRAVVKHIFKPNVLVKDMRLDEETRYQRFAEFHGQPKIGSLVRNIYARTFFRWDFAKGNEVQDMELTVFGRVVGVEAYEGLFTHDLKLISAINAHHNLLLEHEPLIRQLEKKKGADYAVTLKNEGSRVLAQNARKSVMDAFIRIQEERNLDHASELIEDLRESIIALEYVLQNVKAENADVLDTSAVTSHYPISESLQYEYAAYQRSIDTERRRLMTEREELQQKIIAHQVKPGLLEGSPDQTTLQSMREEVARKTERLRQLTYDVYGYLQAFIVGMEYVNERYPEILASEPHGGRDFLRLREFLSNAETEDDATIDLAPGSSPVVEREDFEYSYSKEYYEDRKGKRVLVDVKLVTVYPGVPMSKFFVSPGGEYVSFTQNGTDADGKDVSQDHEIPTADFVEWVRNGWVRVEADESTVLKIRNAILNAKSIGELIPYLRGEGSIRLDANIPFSDFVDTDRIYEEDRNVVLKKIDDLLMDYIGIPEDAGIVVDIPKTQIPGPGEPLLVLLLTEGRPPYRLMITGDADQDSVVIKQAEIYFDTLGITFEEGDVNRQEDEVVDDEEDEGDEGDDDEDFSEDDVTEEIERGDHRLAIILREWESRFMSAGIQAVIEWNEGDDPIIDAELYYNGVPCDVTGVDDETGELFIAPRDADGAAAEEIALTPETFPSLIQDGTISADAVAEDESDDEDGEGDNDRLAVGEGLFYSPEGEMIFEDGFNAGSYFKGHALTTEGEALGFYTDGGRERKTDTILEKPFAFQFEDKTLIGVVSSNNTPEAQQVMHGVITTLQEVCSDWKSGSDTDFSVALTAALNGRNEYIRKTAPESVVSLGMMVIGADGKTTALNIGDTEVLTLASEGIFREGSLLPDLPIFRKQNPQNDYKNMTVWSAEAQAAQIAAAGEDVAPINALGKDEGPKFNIRNFQLDDGDLVIIGSRGAMHNVMTPFEIGALVKRAYQEGLNEPLLAAEGIFKQIMRRQNTVGEFFIEIEENGRKVRIEQDAGEARNATLQAFVFHATERSVEDPDAVPKDANPLEAMAPKGKFMDTLIAELTARKDAIQSAIERMVGGIFDSTEYHLTQKQVMQKRGEEIKQIIPTMKELFEQVNAAKVRYIRERDGLSENMRHDADLLFVRAMEQEQELVKEIDAIFGSDAGVEKQFQNFKVASEFLDRTLGRWQTEARDIAAAYEGVNKR